MAAAGLSDEQKMNYLFRGLIQCLSCLKEAPGLLIQIAKWNKHAELRTMVSAIGEELATQEEITNWKKVVAQKVQSTNMADELKVKKDIIKLQTRVNLRTECLTLYREEYLRTNPLPIQTRNADVTEYTLNAEKHYNRIQETSIEDLLINQFPIPLSDTFNSVTQFGKINSKLNDKADEQTLVLLMEYNTTLKERAEELKQRNDIAAKLIDIEENSKLKGNVSVINADLLGVLNKITGVVTDTVKLFKMTYVSQRLTGTVPVNGEELNALDSDNVLACQLSIISAKGEQVTVKAVMDYITLLQKSHSTDKELRDDPRHYLKRLNTLRQIESNLGINKLLMDEDLRTSIQLVQGHAENKRLFDTLKKQLLKIYKHIQDYNLDKDNVHDEVVVKKTKARELQLFSLNINVATMGDKSQMPVFMSLIKLILEETTSTTASEGSLKKPDSQDKESPQKKGHATRNCFRGRDFFLYAKEAQEAIALIASEGNNTVESNVVGEVSVASKRMHPHGKSTYVATKEVCGICHLRTSGKSHVPHCVEEKCIKCGYFGHMSMNCQNKPMVDGGIAM